MSDFWMRGWTLTTCKHLRYGDEFCTYSPELDACQVPRLRWLGFSVDGVGYAANCNRIIFKGFEPNDQIGIDGVKTMGMQDYADSKMPQGSAE